MGSSGRSLHFALKVFHRGNMSSGYFSLGKPRFSGQFQLEEGLSPNPTGGGSVSSGQSVSQTVPALFDRSFWGVALQCIR